MKSLCVFCGSRSGRSPAYYQAATAFGYLLGEKKIRLIYGGSRMGLMGAVADATLNSQGEVIGVIPRMLVEKELAHAQLTHLEIVDSMHSRKQTMYDLSEAFVALPGGFGTLDELCEIITWGNLQFHSKPCGILNVQGYFDPLLKQIELAAQEGFISQAVLDSLIIESDGEVLIKKIQDAPPGKPKIDTSLM